MDWNSPNASGVGPQSCYNCRGFQNLSLLSVSEKNQRKVNKIEQFSWFWAIFVIKQCNRVEACSPNSSTVGLHGCFNWRGYHNFSLLSVRKKNQRKTNKTARFSWFWALFVIKQWSRMDWNSPNASGVGPQSCYNCRGFQNLSLLSVSEKNQRKVNKIEQFSWFWAIFVIKQCNRVEACSPNSSTVGLHGCFNWRGYHNFSLLSVRKKNQRKTNKTARFSWFWALFVIKQWSRGRVEGNSPNTSGVDQQSKAVTIDAAVRIWACWALAECI